MLPQDDLPVSREKLEEYRRMSVAEKFSLTQRMTEEHLAALLKEPPDIVDQWFDQLRRENDEENRLVLERLARTRQPGLDDVGGQPSASA